MSFNTRRTPPPVELGLRFPRDVVLWELGFVVREQTFRGNTITQMSSLEVIQTMHLTQSRRSEFILVIII